MKVRTYLTIPELEDKVRIINDLNEWTMPDNVWDEDYIIPAKIALIHSEASEAIEAFRNRDMENFSEELADIIIRIFDLTSKLKINIRKEIEDKLEINSKRGYKHGGKKV